MSKSVTIVREREGEGDLTDSLAFFHAADVDMLSVTLRGTIQDVITQRFQTMIWYKFLFSFNSYYHLLSQE